MLKRFVPFALILVVVPLVATAALGGVRGKKIAQETANGEYAIAAAAGDADQPRALFLRVKSRPKQTVSGSWLIVCSRGSGAGSKSGDFEGKTTLVRKLRMPYKKPSSCTVSASAQLDEGGFLKVQLYAKR
jgi:hypothetical protein